mmetsp:Transcript_65572/g.73407  ORF Transcript_65572/g.73407 Transcript_65572/m.73407 type:complete len:207 (+) Transcript_65572:137-757(+)
MGKMEEEEEEEDNNNNNHYDTKYSGSSSSSNGIIRHETHPGSPPPSTPLTPSTPPSLTSSLPSRRFQSRTITATSFIVLKHLFQPMNVSTNHSSSSSDDDRAAKFDSSLLPACIMISNPTPDTLGRFINASATVSRSSSEDATNTMGWDILPSSLSTSTNNNSNNKSTVLFVSDTSQHVKQIVDYMADYSKTSVVGESDFVLKQRV